MASAGSILETRVIVADPAAISIRHSANLDDLEISFARASEESLKNVELATQALREAKSPVAFPTETVYGLGADATRSAAVRGIYAAKNRPIDNPLIVHISSLSQLRRLLPPSSETDQDSIPAIYRPLVERFWPGPLTILLPTSAKSESQLAPEVTAGLNTFGARMPSSPLALALISQSGLPLAAPSANASTRPSPTRAEHVLHDLRGRIEYILDGGNCSVGVESTVVDGLSEPPAVLRPGGISLEDIRRVPGWEACVRGYKDYAEGDERPGHEQINGTSKSTQPEDVPRAPGMKYRHYSPKAQVALVKAGLVSTEGLSDLLKSTALHMSATSIGVLRTKHWQPFITLSKQAGRGTPVEKSIESGNDNAHESLRFESQQLLVDSTGRLCTIYEASLGSAAADAARNLFHALRELDLLMVDVILVEGLGKIGDDEAAAVMNRLSKAAEIKINSFPWP